MDIRRLNYLHLLYLRTVIREGSIRQAAETLHVTPQTISGQLRQLEAELGVRLLQRHGRGVGPTAQGRVVMGYADRIFRLGEELLDHLGRGPGMPDFRVGINALLPRLLVRRVLHPVLATRPAPRLICREGGHEALLRELTARRIDAVLSSERAPAGLSPPVHARELLASPLAAFARGDLAASRRPSFPASLDDAPLLLPSPGGVARSMLDDWFAARDITPQIIGEFDDAALREVFGEAGAGIFLAPAMIREDICRRHGVECIGELPDLTARVFLLTPATGAEHPAVRPLLSSTPS